ncbi:MAG: hypothetical protein ACK4E0_00710 [Chitinophagaceae bacterium]
MKLRKAIILIVLLAVLSAGAFALRSKSTVGDCNQSPCPEAMEEEPTAPRRMVWEGLSDQFFSAF